jgi:small nuclear ribonucleoprotein (snRNP)-like protein
MKDGRILIGVFLCTDFWGNIILGLCSEFSENDYERVLGLVMIPKKHIVSIEVDVAGSTPQAQTQENIVS